MNEKENERLRNLAEVRPELQWFAKQMESKLRKNDHKLHWSQINTGYLTARLYQEYQELLEAIRDGKPPVEIAEEAADVANFAMMIADNAERYKQAAR